MITAAQLRAARGLLDWTRADLAKAAGISPETVKNIEHGTFKPQEGTAENIYRAFAVHDVEFLENEGVRIRRDTVTRYEGVEGFKRFIDDVYFFARDASPNEKPMCVSNVDDRLYVKYLGDYMHLHVKRMNELRAIKARVLFRDKNFFAVTDSSYVEYRWNHKQEAGDVPFYVYGDKFAIIIFSEKEGPQIVVIASAPVAKAYREQFEVLWQNSKPPEKI
jgi:transcriptional regulator with XRE-family HTH domain